MYPAAYLLLFLVSFAAISSYVVVSEGLKCPEMSGLRLLVQVSRPVRGVLRAGGGGGEGGVVHLFFEDYFVPPSCGRCVLSPLAPVPGVFLGSDPTGFRTSSAQCISSSLSVLTECLPPVVLSQAVVTLLCALAPRLLPWRIVPRSVRILDNFRSWRLDFDPICQGVGTYLHGFPNSRRFSSRADVPGGVGAGSRGGSRGGEDGSEPQRNQIRTQARSRTGLTLAHRWPHQCHPRP